MKLVYSRNNQPTANTTPTMEYMHVRDEPERLVHIGRVDRADKTLCGADVSDEPVPEEIVLPNCANCFNAMRHAQRQIARIRKRVPA